MAYNREQETELLPAASSRFCVVGVELKQNEAFMKSVKHFNLPILYSSSGLEFIDEETKFTTLFILNEFEGDVYINLHKANQRILGPTAIMQCAKKKEPLPDKPRPLFTTSMENVVISITGFRSKEELTDIVTLIHHMGGSIRKEFNCSKTTHLLATPAAITGEKYRYAVSMGIPIMTIEWVRQSWSRRHDTTCYATDEELMQFKLLPFVGCKLSFLGYQKEEKEHMVEISVKNGGEVVDFEDPSCTHIIVDDGYAVSDSCYKPNISVVKNEWFWACIQMEAKAHESFYTYERPSDATMSSPLIMPIGGNKRMRLESVATQLAMENLHEHEILLSPDFNKNYDPAKLSISGSFLDSTMSPVQTLDGSTELKELERTLKSPLLDVRSLSQRQQVCFELYQTENNYVKILHTIITVFKEPLENPEQVGGMLLAPAEIKIIFGNLPPIYEIHKKIRIELSEIIHSWSDDHSIGNLILNHAQDLMKSYPPFINFFEETKSLLASCDASKPRFHAFLKRCQSKPECGRQTLQELLIRPVQRLPSIILLLSDILKHTSKSSPDYQSLEKAIQALKDVLLHINEDKRKTEGQVEMFDIVNDIENCPPNLLSSHRNLVSKVDLQEMTDLLTAKKSGTITMFLFTDVLEICKKRGKATSTSKSPAVINLTSNTMTRNNVKTYKHLELISLSHIKRIVDVAETNDCKNAFAIVLWSSKEFKELLYSFILLESINKGVFLRTLCRQIANSICKVDSANLLTSLTPEQLHLEDSECSGNVITKAITKTKSKLGGVLSIKKTLTKRNLNRAVSTMMSSFKSFGTPANSIASWRLTSAANLTELVQTPPGFATCPAIGNKRKSSSLGISFGKVSQND